MTQTPNLGLMKPSESDLFSVAAFNQNADIIDDAFGSRSYQVGDMAPYEGINPPTGWLPCDGREIDPEVYPTLASKLDARDAVITQDTSRFGLFQDFSISADTMSTYGISWLTSKFALSPSGEICVCGNGSNYPAYISSDFFKSNIFAVKWDDSIYNTVTYVKGANKWVSTTLGRNGQSSLKLRWSDDAISWSSPISITISNPATALFGISYRNDSYEILYKISDNSKPFCKLVLNAAFEKTGEYIYHPSGSIIPSVWLIVEGSNSHNSNRLFDTLYPDCDVGEYMVGFNSMKLVEIVKINDTDFTVYNNFDIPEAFRLYVDFTHTNALYIQNFHNKPVIAITSFNCTGSLYFPVVIIIDFATMKYEKVIAYGTSITGYDFSQSHSFILAPFNNGWLIINYTPSQSSESSFQWRITESWMYVDDLEDYEHGISFNVSNLRYNNRDVSPAIPMSRPILCRYNGNVYLYVTYKNNYYAGGFIKFSQYRLPNKPGYIIKAG